MVSRGWPAQAPGQVGAEWPLSGRRRLGSGSDRGPLRREASGAAVVALGDGRARAAGVGARQARPRFSSNWTTGWPLVTVTAPSMTAPLAIAMLLAMMSAWMTAVAPTSSLFSTTNLPEMRPAMTAASGVNLAFPLGLGGHAQGSAHSAITADRAADHQWAAGFDVAVR